MVRKGIIPGLYRLNSGSKIMAKDPLSILIERERKGEFKVSPDLKPYNKTSPVTIGEILKSKGIQLP